MTRVALSDRAVLEVSGGEAARFLQGLITAEVEEMAAGEARSGALLTPQGKVLYDMMLVRDGAGYLVDCHAELAGDLAKRLGFYRLRANVAVSRRDDLKVAWAPAGEERGTTDPRLADLGARSFVAADDCLSGGAQAYHAARIGLGVAEAGADYDPDTVFPHEANLDLLHGVAFDKGCFVGQEVASRIQHRGTQRKRFVPCEVDGEAPERGTEVRAGQRVIGSVGSAAGGKVLALLRLDHLERAGAEGQPLTAGGVRLRPRPAEWLAAATRIQASA